MSISFSGLSSGLDTSSWIEALVSLKQAKVNTYQQQKTTITTAQTALSQIKSYFTTFRSMLEKITDAKITSGTSSDIFSKNLATSSDPGKLTASADADAVEGVYNIRVNKLATNTQAVSNYSRVVSHTDTVTATGATKLSALGVNEGDIYVTVGGVQQAVRLDDSDTIDSLIQKLDNIGVKSEYLEMTGRFILDLDASEIESGSTNLTTALNLTPVNNGYKTGARLTRNESTDVTVNASGTTALSELGLGSNSDMTIKVEGTTVTIAANTTDTIDGLISRLGDSGIQADLADGVFTIHNAEIMDVASNPVAMALGLDATVTNQTQLSRNLRYNTTIVTTSLATGTTRLANVGITGSEFEFTKANGESDTVTVGADATIQDLIDGFAAKGVSADIVNGELKVYNVINLGSELASKLGDSSEVYEVSTSSGNLSYSTTIFTTTSIEGATTLEDLGYDGGSGNVVFGESEIAVTDGTSLTDLLTTLHDSGTSATLVNGVLTISSADRIDTESGAGAAFMEALDLEETVASQSMSSSALTYQAVTTTTNAATLATRINDLNGAIPVTNGSTIVFKNNSNVTRTITLDSTSTIGDIAQGFIDGGASVTQRANGSLYISGALITAEGTYDVVSSLKLNSITSFGDNVTYSGSELTYNTTSTDTVAATNDTLLSDAGITSGQIAVIQNGVRRTAYISEGDTIGDLRSLLQGYGIQAALTTTGSGSVLNLYADGDSYIESVEDGSNLVSSKFTSDKITKYNYTSDKPIVSSSEETVHASSDKLVTDFGVTAGAYDLYQNGVRRTFYISNSDTFADLKSNLASYGIQASLVESEGNVQLKCLGTGDTYLDCAALNDSVVTTRNYKDTLSYTTSHVETVNPNNSSRMSDYGITSGQYYIYNNGVRYVANISMDETFGSFRETLQSFGVQSAFVEQGDDVKLVLNGTGDTYVTAPNISGWSNLTSGVNPLFTSQTSEYDYSNYLYTIRTDTTTITAGLNDRLADYSSESVTGKLDVTIDGISSTVSISADETFGSLINKFDRLGVGASLVDGVFTIESGEKSISIAKSASDGSDVLTGLNLEYNSNLGGMMVSSSAIQYTDTYDEEEIYSASKYADDSTKLGTINVTSGTLSVYRNGQKATINVDSNKTFEQFRDDVQAKFADVDVSFVDGYLRFTSSTEGVNVQVGSSVDTSNFTTICGLVSDGNSGVTSSRELYKVNAGSTIMGSDLFRRRDELGSDVTAGTFIIGDATFTIDSGTTISSLIAQINSSDEAQATAYWDSVDGKLVLNSRKSGSTYLNIEAGTSNFTDIMGYTNTDMGVSQLNSSAQTIGNSASFTINGTTYTSTDNLVDSSITRINGVTINLKGLTEGEDVTLTIEKDTETIANAVADVVDAYNELIKNIDTEIAKDGNLSGQSGLKLLRNQIRTMMMNSFGGGTTYKNLSQIGITTEAASGANISTSGINTLTFDKTAFANAYKKDNVAVKRLLIGSDESNKGIFGTIEQNYVERALESYSGYFHTAESSYSSQIEKINNKISKQNDYITRYQAQLQKKFQAMESMISKIQQQYQSFLTN